MGTECIFPVRQVTLTPPVALPISLGYAKQQARMDETDTSIDGLIATYINTAVDLIQAYAGFTLVQTGYEAYYNAFPCCMKIQDINVSVTEIEYIDTNGDTQTLAATEYEIFSDEVFAYIASTGYFPCTLCNTPDAVKVRYTAGYEAVSGLVTALTQSGGVATAICDTDHKLFPGGTVTVLGAGEAEYNGTFSTIYPHPSTVSFQYNVDSATVSPATGTITFTNLNIPADILQAIALMATAMIANSGDCSDECTDQNGGVTCGAAKIINKYKMPQILTTGGEYC